MIKTIFVNQTVSIKTFDEEHPFECTVLEIVDDHADVSYYHVVFEDGLSTFISTSNVSYISVINKANLKMLHGAKVLDIMDPGDECTCKDCK